MITLNHYLLVAGILFAIGLAGVVVRRNIIVIYMCLEMMLSAANLTLVAFSRFHVVDGAQITPPSPFWVFSPSPWRPLSRRGSRDHRRPVPRQKRAWTWNP